MIGGGDETAGDTVSGLWVRGPRQGLRGDGDPGGVDLWGCNGMRPPLESLLAHAGQSGRDTGANEGIERMPVATERGSRRGTIRVRLTLQVDAYWRSTVRDGVPSTAPGAVARRDRRLRQRAPPAQDSVKLQWAWRA